MRNKILAINLGNFGSTGTIAESILLCAKDKGFVPFYAYPDNPQNKKNAIRAFKICSFIFCKIFARLACYTGLNGLFSFFHTFLLLKFMKQQNIDLVHFHNLHNSYVNLPMLFHFVKKHKIPIIWTLHDCWSFTGRCPYFDLVKCGKWKTGCHNCCYPKNSYPQSKIDRSRLMWNLKKKWFAGIENCLIVTPSQWLADLVKQSFLKVYPVKVINNGIDLSVFKPTESSFREKYNLKNKKMVLGVAFGWGTRKGLDVFVELSRRLPNDYQIILVGTDDTVDKLLPANVISIHRTQNQKELAEIYTAADVFVNPTREENYPTVNMESLACGTPVVTFKTGGSPEIIDETSGSVIDCDDVGAMEIEIRRICEEYPYSKEACLKRAKSFDMKARFEEYIQLYKEML